MFLKDTDNLMRVLYLIMSQTGYQRIIMFKRKPNPHISQGYCFTDNPMGVLYLIMSQKDISLKMLQDVL